MDELTRHAFDQMLGSGLTTHPLDNKRAVIVLRVAKNSDCYDEVLAMVKSKRDNHRLSLTLWQRKWQMHMRSVTPKSCIHRYNIWGERHDLGTLIRADEESIAVRERYVRCDNIESSIRPIERTWN